MMHIVSSSFHLFSQTKIEPEFVLYLDCPEDELERRILSRNQVLQFVTNLPCFDSQFFVPQVHVIFQGRADDNTETMRKRFRVFKESTLPVIKHYDLKGKVRKVIPQLLFFKSFPMLSFGSL